MENEHDGTRPIEVGLTILSVVVALAVIAGTIFGGWELGWWFHAQNVNRETNIERHSNSFQQSYLTAVQNYEQQVATIDTQLANPQISAQQKNGLRGERLAIASRACNNIGFLDPQWITPDISGFRAQNC